MSNEKCPITGLPAEKSPKTGDGETYTVTLAGISYKISDTALAELQGHTRMKAGTNKLKFRRFVYEKNIKGEKFPSISTEEINAICDSPMPSLKQRFDWFVEYFYALHNFEEEMLLWQNILTERGSTITCSSRKEISEFLLMSVEDKLVDKVGDTGSYIPTVKGAAFIEETKAQKSSSQEVFVAMWFDNEMNDYFENIKGEVEAATGLTLVRIDRQDFNRKIDDEIIANLRSCRLVIADFTAGNAGKNARGGVYYEAGFAHGLGKEVVFTVREDCLSEVHFDTRQFNHIVWKNVKGKPVDANKEDVSLAERIINRIRAMDNTAGV